MRIQRTRHGLACLIYYIDTVQLHIAFFDIRYCYISLPPQCHKVRLP